MFDGSSGDYLIANGNAGNQFPNVKPPHQIKPRDSRVHKAAHDPNYPYMQSKSKFNTILKLQLVKRVNPALKSNLSDIYIRIISKTKYFLDSFIVSSNNLFLISKLYIYQRTHFEAKKIEQSILWRHFHWKFGNFEHDFLGSCHCQIPKVKICNRWFRDISFYKQFEYSYEQYYEFWKTGFWKSQSFYE